ncbi:MAG: Asp-tRNA(Asn)/Glu-tRNA(Gln) amidotransferase subunit GatC [bacterium]
MAALSRLQLTNDEIVNATRDLTNILNHFATIQNIDTEDVPTYDNATGLTNITRADEAVNEDLCSCAVLIKAAPATRKKHIQVHAVF